MPFIADYTDRDYVDYRFRIDEEGYVSAPTAPGLGVPINMDALHNSLKRIDR
jgi:L-alanine-DL-glutamate epimerase-like enolase superfamily enzyme